MDVYISKYNQVKYNWEDISSIKLNAITIHLCDKNKDVKHIELGQFDYMNVRLVKEKISEFAKTKDIEIN